MKNISIIILIISLSASSVAYGQKRKADKEFKHLNYALAIQHYLKYLKKHDVDGQTALNMAESYSKINKSEEAAEWYAKASKLENMTPEAYLHYGNALKENGDYLDAIDQYIKYGSLVPDKKLMAKEFANSCYQALEWMSYPQQIDVQNEEKLNSPQSDFSPVMYKGKMIFTSDRKLAGKAYLENELAGWTGNPYLEIVQLENDSIAKLFSPKIAGPYHDGPAAFSSTGDTMFFTRTLKVKNPKKETKNSKGGPKNLFINRLELWYSVKKNGNWQEPIPFQYNNKHDYSVGHATFSSDGKVLYFVSDMPGGYGETDIYYSIAMPDSNKWSEPKNLGRKVNSVYKEVFPTYFNKSLYFASDRPSGMGGLDIYLTQGGKSDWTQAENLKYPMNSSKDDFGLLLDSTGKSGYISSDRVSSSSDDIYSFKQPGCVLAGITLEKVKNGEDIILENAMIELYKKGDTTEVVGYARSSTENKLKVCVRSYQPCQIQYDAKGKFFFQIQQEKPYEIKASKEGYFTQTISVPDDCKNPGDTINIAVVLNKVELNKPIVIEDLFFDDDNKMYFKKNIYFDLDKANIRYDASLTLNKLVDLLKDNPTLKVELGAHTDSRQSAEYNLNLSQKRAESAVSYITSKGVDSDRITAKGYGESQLINDCKDGVECSEEKHQENRRVEIKVVAIENISEHKVLPNETIFSIGRKYNLTSDQVKEMNSLTEDRIFPGDILKIK